eukprot:6178542-Pleurochrysis_carterae.AAC.3
MENSAPACRAGSKASPPCEATSASAFDTLSALLNTAQPTPTSSESLLPSLKLRLHALSPPPLFSRASSHSSVSAAVGAFPPFLARSSASLSLFSSSESSRFFSDRYCSARRRRGERSLRTASRSCATTRQGHLGCACVRAGQGSGEFGRHARAQTRRD